MKYLTQLFILFLFTNLAFAQKTSNVIIFAEDATPFYAIVNGIKQNIEPQTNVKITGLTNPANQIKVIFKDPSIPSLDKQIYFQEMNMEATMKITSTNKGYKLRYFGEVSMGASVPDPSQNTIIYQTVEPVATVTSTTTPVSTTVVTQETVVTNSTSGNSNATVQTRPTTANSESINMNVNVGGVGFNMDVNLNDNMGDIHTDTQNGNANVNYNATTTTTTTTTTTGGIETNNNITATEPVYYVDGYTGNVGCSIPSQSLHEIKSAVDSESFSDNKMMVAKQATKNKCLTTAQVIEIADLFSFEDDKLEYAKFAYPYTYDVGNYYKVNSIFSFSSSKDELNDFINK